MKKIIFLFTFLLTICIGREVNAHGDVNQVDATTVSKTIDLGEISSPHTFTVYIDQNSEIYLGTAAAIQKMSTNSYGNVTFRITADVDNYSGGSYGGFYYEIYTSDKSGKYKGIGVIGKFK